MYMEIDNELINLNQITKIKKAKTSDSIYSVIFEEAGKPAKTVKYNNSTDMNTLYEELKSKLLEEYAISVYKDMESRFVSSRLFGV